MSDMKWWKRGLLAPYYYAAVPWRRLRLQREAAQGRAPVMVVYYHRIADDDATDWTLSNALFHRQIDWLQRHYELVTLDEAQRRLRMEFNPCPCVAITFDDGYADNCEQALPLLIERKIPCTYFVVTGHVVDGRPFPHDVQRGHRFRPNSVAELRSLAAAGIDIGAHTRTHADLGRIRRIDELYDEVIAAGDELQDRLGRAVRHFAFPFGMPVNLQPRAFSLAKDRYDSVSTAYGGYNRPGDDPFHLQRIGAEGPLLRLKNWLTVDPLKERSVRRYTWQSPSLPALAEMMS